MFWLAISTDITQPPLRFFLMLAFLSNRWVEKKAGEKGKQAQKKCTSSRSYTQKIWNHFIGAVLLFIKAIFHIIGVIFDFIGAIYHFIGTIYRRNFPLHWRDFLLFWSDCPRFWSKYPLYSSDFLLFKTFQPFSMGRFMKLTPMPYWSRKVPWSEKFPSTYKLHHCQWT